MARYYSFLFVFAMVSLARVVHCLPKPSTPTADLNLVLHPEYLGFGEWVDSDAFPIENLSPALADKQLQVRCFPELRHDKSKTNVSDGFYATTVDRLDSLYGVWKIRAKLPSIVHTSMRISLINSGCKPPLCPQLLESPAAVMRVYPDRPSDIEFSLMNWSDDELHSDTKTTRKLPSYENSFHTYEFAWMPDNFEWRIDGKVVAGFFDAKTIPQQRMTLYISAFCGDDGDQVPDEDSSFTISSIVYTPPSSSDLGRLASKSSTIQSGSAFTTEPSTGGPLSGFWKRTTTPGPDEVATTGRYSSAFDRSVDLIAEQYQIIMDAIKKIAGIAVRINDDQWISELRAVKSKSSI